MRYKVQTPNHGVLEIEGPEGASDDQLKAVALQELRARYPGERFANTVKRPGPKVGVPIDGYGAADSAIHSASLGLDSIGVGAANGLANAIVAPFSKSEDFHPIQSFNEARQNYLDAGDQYAANNPGGSAASGLVGAFIGAPGKAIEAVTHAPGFLSRLLKSAGVGAASAGTQAALESRDWNDIPGNLVGGTAVGGMLGAAIPTVGGVVSPLVKAGRIAINRGQGLAVERVANALGSDMVSPSQAGSVMDQAAGLGVPRVLADAGENTARLMGATARQPGQARAIVRGFLKDRQGGQGERLQEAITRDIGPVGNVAAQSDAIMKAGSERAAPLYAKSDANLVPDTPELRALLATPAGKAALGRAHTIAGNERVDPTELGFALDSNGDVVLNPPNMALHGDIASAKDTLDTATQALQKAQRAVLGGGGVAGEVPRLQAEAAKARVDYDAAVGALNAAPSAGTAATGPVYSQRTLDYVKRGLDSVLEDSRDKVTGRLNLDDVGRSVENVRKSFLRTVDDLNPDYAAARAAFAGPAREADALRLGQEMIGKSASEIERATSRMNESERAQFALGMRSKLSENLDRRADGGNKVDYLSNTPQRRAVLQNVAGPDANLERFQQALGHEDAAQRTYGIAMNGSPTAINLADDALNEDAGLAQSVLGRFMRGSKSGLWSGITNAAAPLLDASRFGAGRTGDRVRDEIAALLTERDPRVFQAALDDLAARNTARRVKAGRLGLQASNILGTVAGRTVPTLGQ